MKTQFPLLAMMCLAFTGVANAQMLVIDNGSTSPWVIGSQDFNVDSEGISTLSTSSPNYVADLSTLALPGGLPNTGSGWVFTNSSGTVVISDPTGSAAPVALGDPFVAYNYAFFNSTAGPQSFSMQFSASFPDESFAPSLVRASFGVTLTDGTAGGTGVSVTPSQSAQLTFNSGNTVIYGSNAGVTLSPPLLTATLGQSTTENAQTVAFPNYINGPSGVFNTLTVTVSGTYSAGAELGVTGRIDAVPEPSTWAMFLGGCGALALWRLRRNRRSL